MKIRKPILEGQMNIFRRRQSTFHAVWDAAAKLKAGEWLPVECADESEKAYLRMTALGHRTKRFHTRSNKLTMYIGRCTDKNCTAKHRAPLNGN